MVERTTERLCDTYDRKLFSETRDRLIQEKQAPKFSENATSVLTMRYFQKDSEGKPIEDSRGLIARVAAYIGMAEHTYNKDGEKVYSTIEDFYNIMASGDFLPNSPTLMNAGRENSRGLLSACFVLPVEDSIDGIFSAVRNTALIQQAGGGTGFAFDRLRPTGDRVSSSGGTTSGPISFMKVFSEATNAIQQGAFRRGANMGMMDITHPTILSFIYAKTNNNSFGNFNLSVKITDKWMEEFLKDRDSPHIVVNKRDQREYYIPRGTDVKAYGLGNLISAEVGKEVPQNSYTKGEIWDMMMRNAHHGAEPGIVFIDKMNRDNPTPEIGEIEATNPCGEQPLLPYESCNLGSINLGNFIIGEQGNRKIDYERLGKTVELATRFLDDVVDVNNYPLEEIDEISRGNRKIGLGVMGFADMLTMLRIPYGSEESFKIGRDVMGYIRKTGDKTSENLAEERGVFPNYEKSIFKEKTKRRNAATGSVAPTGTISIIANSAGGIEPLFALVLTHKDGEGNKRLRIDRNLENDLREEGFDDQGIELILEELKKRKSLKDIKGIPEWMPKVYVTAHDLIPEQHIMMQAAFQENTDASISKTINYSNDASVEDIGKGFILAYELGCKGITVYRDGCIPGQPLSIGDTRKEENPLEKEVKKQIHPPKGGWHNKLFPANYFVKSIDVPDIMPAVRVKQKTSWGNMHVKFSVDPTTGREYEVFAQVSKGGDVISADLEGLCRAVSVYLRSGGDIREMKNQLRGIGSNMASIPLREGKVNSLPDGLGAAMDKLLVAKDALGIENLLLGRYDETFIDDLYDSLKTKIPISELRKEGNGKLTEEGKSEEKEKEIIPEQRNGYEEPCPECKEGRLVHYEGCKRCDLCQHTICG